MRGQNTTRTIEVIPQTIDPVTRMSMESFTKRKVAGYARVSTDHDEQFTSFTAQVDYYTRYIAAHSDWQFVNVYTDEGISGTNTKHRDGFNQMIEDALAGKIDLIVTKSISRFARNTLDTLDTVRKLKAKGVECYFEKENIYTFDSKGELFITIMASLAQEESRSISENVTWGQRKRFSDGKVNLPYKHFLGYRKGEDGLPEIVPEEAEIIKRIYREFISGKTPWTIAQELTDEGIPTPAGKDNWQVSTVNSILQNEKYKGAAFLQKEFTVDFLTKKRKKNEGEVQQFYIENSHDAIIPPDEWESVQMEILRRKGCHRHYSGNSIFSGKIICGDCGEFYGMKVWNSTSEKYRRTVWQCNGKFRKKEKKCSTPHLTEEAIKEKFIAAFNAVFDIRTELLDNCKEAAAEICDTASIDEEINSTYCEIMVVKELMRQAIDENAHITQDQNEYQKRFKEYEDRFDELKAKYDSLRDKKTLTDMARKRFDHFNRLLRKQETALTEFDENLWRTAVETVTCYSDGKMVFRFVNGNEVTV